MRVRLTCSEQKIRPESKATPSWTNIAKKLVEQGLCLEHFLAVSLVRQMSFYKERWWRLLKHDILRWANTSPEAQVYLQQVPGPEVAKFQAVHKFYNESDSLT